MWPDGKIIYSIIDQLQRRKFTQCHHINIGQKFAQNFAKYSKYAEETAKDWYNFAKNGEISSNLITLFGQMKFTFAKSLFGAAYKLWEEKET